MRIESMTATFGKLHGETLTFSSGLNVLQLPNEAGKSTWCAFLLAMLYGVDTSERESRTRFPVKKHYAPWSGNAMEGRLVLTHEGRSITIERSGTARSPMSTFRAFDTESGQPIPTLTAQNCGQTLLGVPRQVFERSAFVRQDGAAIQMEATLEQRLAALVTTGDEAISYQQAERTLRERRNRCRHNKTGLIPQTQAKLDAVCEKLRQLDQLHETMAQAHLERQKLLSQLHVQRLQLSALQAQQAGERRVQLAKAHEKAKAAIDEAKRLEEACAALPPMQTLNEWERERSQLESEQHTLMLDFASLPQNEAAPTLPQPFAGLDADAIRRKAEVDGAHMRLLQAQKKPSSLGFLLPAVLLAIVSLFFLFRGQLPAMLVGGLALVAALVGGVSYAAKRHTWQENQRELRQICEHYDVTTPEALSELCDDCCTALAQWHEATAAYARELQALHESRSRLDRASEAFLVKLYPVFGQLANLAEADARLREVISMQLACESAHRSAEQAYQHYRSLKEAVGTLPDPAAPSVHVPEGKTIAVLQSEIRASERALQQVRSTLDHGEGQCSTLGDRMELEARRQQFSAQLGTLVEEYDALDLALEAIGKANEQLRHRFSPRLTALSADYLSRLTGGAYSRLVLTHELGASLYAPQSPAGRDAAYFSGGTRDQLYLAVRLAVSQLLVPEAPLILDDALVRFDDARLEEALKVLRQEAEHRQVLLFTCQSREQTALSCL